MRWSWRADRRRAQDLLPPATDAIVEGSWIAVAYAAIEIAAGQTLRLGLISFALAALVGIAVARRPGVRPEGADRIVRLAGGVALGIVGWLASPDLGGWMLGLAFVRGTAHGAPWLDDLVVARILRRGLPGLAVPWLVSIAVGAPDRTAFVEAAFPSTLLFVAAGLFGTGLTRLEALGAEAGLDWRANRAWLALAAGVAGLVALAGIPAAFLLGEPLDALLRAFARPLADLLGAIVPVVSAVLAPLMAPLDALLSTRPNLPNPPAVPTGPPGAGAMPGGPAGIAGSIGPVAFALILAGLVVAVAAVRRRIAHLPAAADMPELPREERTIVLPSGSIRIPHLRLPRVARRRRPATATAAYVALLADLEGSAAARLRSESPASHARRLRPLGLDGLRLGRLAADYQLERYAGRPLTAQETRRAIDRWRRLRHGPVVRGGPSDGGRD